MAADNTLLSTNVGVGETIRSLGDAGGLNWPVGASAYPTTISAGANVLQIVDLTHGLPVQSQTGATWAVSAVSLPLPTGAATDAKQDTGNVSLASMDTKTPALGQALAAASVPVVLTVAQLSTLTPLTSVAVTNAGTFAVQAAQSGTWTVTGAGGTFPVTDSGGSLTVDAPVGTPVFVRLSDGSAAITTLPVSLTSTTITGTVAVTQSTSPWVVSLTSTTITGTVAVTQSGTWNITNVSGTISLPTGAATSALQDDTYTPITPATATATAGTLLGMQYNSTQATFTNGQQGTVQGTSRGAVYVAVGADGFAVTLASTTITGTVAATQSGTWNIGTLTGTTTLTPGTGATNLGKAEDGASADGDVGVGMLAVRKASPANTSGTDGDYEFLQMSAGRLWASATIDAALPAGTNGIGKLTANSGVTIGAVEIAAAQTLATVTTVGTVTLCSTVTTVGTVSTLTQWNAGHGTAAAALRVELPTDGTGVVGLNAGSAIVGKVGIDQTTPGTTNAVQDIPATSGGLLKFHLVSAATTNATNVKASAGQVYTITAFNLNAAARYIKFHNTAGTPTAGAGVTDSFLIPGNTAGAGFVINFDKGISFSTGIGITTTTGIADADSAAVAASELLLNIYYK